MGKANTPPVPGKKKASNPAGMGKDLFTSVVTGSGHRILLYGTGGIGKTSLAMNAPGPVAFFDFDDSLGMLPDRPKDLHIVAGSSWEQMLSALRVSGWEKIKTIVIDSITRAEELCIEYVLATIKHEKGGKVNSLEGYGWGKGYTHVFETFIELLGILDVHRRAGRNIILVAHECTATVPNPFGDDYIRYEPRIQSPASGKNSVRLRVKEWSDHTLFVGYDVDVSEGKGTGQGTRTVYPTELPHCMAKSRKLTESMPYEYGSTVLWDALFA